MSGFLIEKLRETDAESSVNRINELLSELVRTGRTTSARDIVETLRECHVLVIREERSSLIVGMGTVSKAKQLGRSYAVVDDVVISKAYRGNELFSRLMDELEELARVELGVARIELHTSRADAATLYRKRGYHLHISDIYRKAL